MLVMAELFHSEMFLSGTIGASWFLHSLEMLLIFVSPFAALFILKNWFDRIFIHLSLNALFVLTE